MFWPQKFGAWHFFGTPCRLMISLTWPIKALEGQCSATAFFLILFSWWSFWLSNICTTPPHPLKKNPLKSSWSYMVHCNQVFPPIYHWTRALKYKVRHTEIKCENTHVARCISKIPYENSLQSPANTTLFSFSSSTSFSVFSSKTLMCW